MLDKAVECMLPDIAPMGRSFGEVDSGFAQNLLHLRNSHPHQTGIPICAAALIINPIGAQVTFFKNVHPQVQGPGQLYGLSMHGARVAIQHDVSDGFLRDDLAQCGRPSLLAFGMSDETRFIVSKKCVTAIKTDPPSGSACLFQKLPQLAEEWTMRAL